MQPVKSPALKGVMQARGVASENTPLQPPRLPAGQAPMASENAPLQPPGLPERPAPMGTGTSIGNDDVGSFRETLEAVDFDLDALGWGPDDFVSCYCAFYVSARQLEATGAFVAAERDYRITELVARHTALHVHTQGALHLGCMAAMRDAKQGRERCVSALLKSQAPQPARGVDEVEAVLQRMPPAVRTHVQRERERLKSSQGGVEAEMDRRYLEWCLALPWGTLHPGKIDIQTAKRILDADHQGLGRVKERILEEIALHKRLGKPTGRVLCLVGPPGVGKTSVVASIARAMNKQLLRQALGGVSDEMEIRGNNRSYVGSQPGRILQGMRDCQYVDPVYLLDEVDKIVRQTNRGDPSSALLELLDPEQNHAFKDHYLGFGYDLSKVTFICTANYLEDIPPALRDRLEILELAGYTATEKQAIATTHLIPKQLQRTLLDDTHLQFTPQGLATIIQGYTQEAGVRELEKKIAAICRKVVTQIETSKSTPSVVTDVATVHALLGPPRYKETTRLRNMGPGMVNGLAWTQAGGVLLPVEVNTYPGSGTLTITGNVKKVMEESAHIARDYLKANYPTLTQAAATQDTHIHFPAGAVQKDGPSAGVTLVTAMASAYARRAVPDDVTMTGEVGLFGEIWPVGGIKEKALAAYTAGFKRLFLPEANAIDLEDIPQEVKDNVQIVFVSTCAQLLAALFGELSNTRNRPLGSMPST